jgi:hypothetical protein
VVDSLVRAEIHLETSNLEIQRAEMAEMRGSSVVDQHSCWLDQLAGDLVLEESMTNQLEQLLGRMVHGSLFVEAGEPMKEVHCRHLWLDRETGLALVEGEGQKEVLGLTDLADRQPLEEESFLDPAPFGLVQVRETAAFG